MRSIFIWAAAIWAGLAAPSARAAEGPASHGASAPATGAATQPDTRKVIQVKTMDAFLDALGSDRIIELAPGEYNLSGAVRRVGKAYEWKEAMVAGQNQFELVIHDVDHLTIRTAATDKPAHFISSFTYANILCLHKCTNVDLINLKLGHAPDVGQCSGGVVEAADSQQISVQKCDLYGCGIQGFTLEKVQHLLVSHSVIHDCSYCAMVASHCDDLRFEESDFSRTGDLGGFTFSNCTKVAFVGCLVEEIKLTPNDDSTPLFFTNLSDTTDPIHFIGGAIRNVRAAALVNTAGMVKLDNVKQEGNTWAGR